MKNSFGFLQVSILLFLLVPYFSFAQPQDPLQPGIDAFLKGDIGEAAEFFRSAETVFSGDPMISGRVSLWKGRILLEEGDEYGAEELLKKAAAAGEELAVSLEEGGGRKSETAEAYRLQADALAEIMLFKGVPYMIKNGGRVQELAEKALELDGDNPVAGIIFAQGRINAPRIFGGNSKEGIGILRELAGRRDLPEYQMYRILTALADASADKDPEGAEEFLRKAEAIYQDFP